MRFWSYRSWCIPLLLAAGHCALASDRDLIGYTALAARAGSLQADGAGIPVAQVEAFAPGTSDYAPNTALTSFAGKTFTFRSGASAISSHASQVAGLYYGSIASPAPDVPVVSLFSAESFITGLLRSGRANRAPGGVGASVVNNSWIADLSDDAANFDVLHRLDDLINRDDVLVFNAVSNTASDPFPKLLAASYNGVSVGTLTGTRGPLLYDGAVARIKPDLVVNTGITSNSSALAAGAGALLRSEAKVRGLPASELATKAMLMAGAQRDVNWHRGRLSGADNVTAPLDFQQGAGQLRVDHSFDILTAGKQSAGTSIAPAGGWDYARTARGTSDASYYLHVDQTQPNWAAFLTWNRSIAGVQPDGHYSTAATLADFDLSLYLSRRSGRRLVAQSDSPGDNVESLTLTGLAPGDYQLVLTSDIRSYYGLAWYEDTSLSTGLAAPLFINSGAMDGMNGSFISAVPEPSSVWLTLASTAVMLLGRRRTRSCVEQGRRRANDRVA
ncbi:MAG: fibronectin [Phycisphaerales bacterium]|nr:fibronectin [Phycisphaerales bacterium]